MGDLWKIVPAVGCRWCPHESHDHDGRDFTRWNFRRRSHFGQWACSPSSEMRSRHSHSRHVRSSGNSRMNSMSEYEDSEPLPRRGLFRSTFAMLALSHAGYLP
ncbi:MAG: hypothetical protein M3R38_34295 [Actinomycetota bacterium]|nr:hypothetical protein [Actinomycetota bacterium]